MLARAQRPTGCSATIWMQARVVILPCFSGSHALCVKGRSDEWVIGCFTTGMILPASLPGCTIDRVIRSPHHLVVLAHVRRDHGRCPACGTSSSAVHSRYDRRPADLPSLGQAVTLRLRLRRFYCQHPRCRRRIFAEAFPRLLPSRARRTRRLARAQARVGLALGGEAGARLTRHLAMPTSPDTWLTPRPPPPAAGLRSTAGRWS